jgi:hypothetical protein
MDHPVDFGRRGLGVVQHRLRRGHLPEHIQLGRKRPHFMMQQGVACAFGEAWRPTDDQHRCALGKGLRGRVDQLQAAYAIRDAHDPKPRESRIGIRRKTRPLLIARINYREPTLTQLAIEVQDIVPLNPEHVARSCCVNCLDQVLGDRHRRPLP